MIEEVSQDPIWQELYGYTTDRRMKGSELILRFISLHEDLRNYQKPLSSFLNTFCEKNQRADANKIEYWKNLFLSTTKKLHAYLGEYAFRTIDDGRPNKNINAALFDAQMAGFSKYQDNIKKIPKPLLVKRLMYLYDEPQFKEAITSGTSATNLVKYRIKRFTDFLMSEEA